MGHGGPDWGTAGPLSTVYTIEDMAELAARLGSIDVYDRRGNIVFLEDFEGPLLNWAATGGGVNEEQRLYNESAYQGCQCVYLRPGDDVEDYSQIARRFQVARNQRYSLETRFYHFYGKAAMTVRLIVYEGFKKYTGVWQYDSKAEELLIQLGEDDWKVIDTGIKAGLAFSEWYPSKLVVDSQTNKYVRGLFLGKEYDLSEEALWPDDVAIETHLISVSIIVVNALGVSCYALVDNIIVKQNEP